MSVTRKLTAATAVKSVLAAAVLAATVSIGAAIAGGAGQDLTLATVVCPADTHWSVTLGVCVRDTP
ncbi:hypothetical protein OG792_04635 [Micromonospora sp. NBC_01699]|uniref:hypothetical protein n=1 Tax=Micromonospora sp. NBC_01699 TaxID=2975984 RepID=UPI002E327827|nr:hypothetical protein [Micromonospora sp. NBC_01699]